MSAVSSLQSASASDDSIPLVVHLIYRLDFGGLENLMVERINRMPANRYRHAIVCLTGYTDFPKKSPGPASRSTPSTSSRDSPWPRTPACGPCCGA